MRLISRRLLAIGSGLAALALAVPGPAAAASHRGLPYSVQWMKGFAAPGTPKRLDKVGILKIGSPRARNVLVFEPGTTAGSGYIVPFAQWLTARMPNWQVWSVERRQNLLEDQSVLTLAKEHKATAPQVYDYYLKWIFDSKIKHHVRVPSDKSVAFAKDWGLNVAIQDLRIVIRRAQKLGGHVVLSGHSLGGALVTAYATWNFGGRAGARGLSGLVFDDGASFGAPDTAAQAQTALAGVKDAASPWAGIQLPGAGDVPLLGLLSTTGGLSAIQEPNQPSLGQNFFPHVAVTKILDPPVRATNLAVFAYNTNVSTSILGQGDFAILAHEGTGIATKAVQGVHGWNASGALTPPQRYARMLSGPQVNGADGVEWYFPSRLTVDIRAALGSGLANAADAVMNVHATMGKHLPHNLLMYAFGAFGGKAILDATKTLADQSHIPAKNLLLVNRNATYAHNDPAGAYPKNAFFTNLVKFLRKVDAHH
jgi:hypothetical protein